MYINHAILNITSLSSIFNKTPLVTMVTVLWQYASHFNSYLTAGKTRLQKATTEA